MRLAFGYRYSRRRHRLEFLWKGRRVAWLQDCGCVPGGLRCYRQEMFKVMMEAGMSESFAAEAALSPFRLAPSWLLANDNKAMGK